MFVIVGLLLLVIALDVSRRRYQAELSNLSTRLEQLTGNGSEQNTKEIADRVKAAVGKHIVLMSDNPTIATIANVTLLRQQNAFYNDAENGDFVVIDVNKEGQAKAILYREKDDMIINVVPVQFTQQSSAAGDAAAGAQQPADGQAMSAAPQQPEVQAAQ